MKQRIIRISALVLYLLTCPVFAMDDDFPAPTKWVYGLGVDFTILAEEVKRCSHKIRNATEKDYKVNPPMFNLGEINLDFVKNIQQVEPRYTNEKEFLGWCTQVIHDNARGDMTSTAFRFIQVLMEYQNLYKTTADQKKKAAIFVFLEELYDQKF